MRIPLHLTRHRLFRHLLAFLIAAPTTTAIAVAIVTPFLETRSASFYTAELLFVFGTLTGYLIELVLFLPVYALAQRYIVMTGWRTVGIGAVMSCPASLIMSGGRLLHFRDAIEVALSPFGLLALGAIGGAIYWSIIRNPQPQIFGACHDQAA